ncbi:MAG: ferrous iron transport protein B [Bacteroidales bacterium]
MLLSELPTGQSGVITRVRGRGAFRRRIMEMGFVKGKQVTVIKNAPLNDPVQYSLLGYEVSLRRTEAALVELQDFQQDRENDFGSDIIRTFDGEGFQTIEKLRSRHILVALVGNPNSGKTSLFNALTHSSEKVGNYAGVTIESKSALVEHKGYTIEFVDLPGTYSLSAYTPEERYVLDFITDSMPDVIINVVDGSNLERNLYLTTQLIDIDQRVIIALNMFDELVKRGDKIDIRSLGLLLGMPVIPTVGARGRGIQDLLERILEVYDDVDPIIRHIHIQYGEEPERSLLRVQEKIKRPGNFAITDRVSSRFIALRLLEGDRHVGRFLQMAENRSEIEDTTRKERERLGKLTGSEAEATITDAKYGFIAGALRETLRRGSITGHEPTSRIDSLLTHRYLGFPVFFLFLFIMFQGTFTLGSYPVQWIGSGVSWLTSVLESSMNAGALKDLILQGVIGGVGGVIVFLPNILILFLFIALMEDTGYMARAAFMMDRVMHRMGLHGRSFIPLIMGFGCNVPAIMATRTIETRGNRILTMLINPFMSCSARLPVYVLMISAFFPGRPGLVLFALYSTGIFLAVIMAILFKRIFFRSGDLPFVMELPPYRIPTARAIMEHMWNRAGQYLRKMGGIILIASVLVWALGYYPVPEGGRQDGKTEKVSQQDRSTAQPFIGSASETKGSWLARMGEKIEPLLVPLGMDWRMGVSLITGIAGKEIVVSTMGVIFDDGNPASQGKTLSGKLQEATWTAGTEAGKPLFTQLSALSYLVFILVYFPCIAVVAAVRNESGSWKWALFLVGYTTGLAWLLSFAVYQFGTWMLTL